MCGLKTDGGLDELYALKIAALLHDIGKPESWAKTTDYPDRDKYPSHACATKRLTAPLGDSISVTAARHHKWSQPQTEAEWIICKSDRIASGADRGGEWEEKQTERGTALPIEFSHVLSYGVPIRKWNASELQKTSHDIEIKIKQTAEKAISHPAESYLEFYDFLESSLPLRFIPADTRPPINDVSLWHHLKLTTALATCIWLDGTYSGDLDLQKCKFALLIGDTGGIEEFINVSKRPPDLSARRETIKRATVSVAQAVNTVMGGPECVIFAERGSFLAIIPRNKVASIISQAEERFRTDSDDELTMSMYHEEVDGTKLMERIDEVWKKLFREMRTRKLEEPRVLNPDLKEGDQACDICGFRKGIHETADHDRFSYDANPRFELRCDVDRQRLDSQRGHGIKLDNVADESGLVALINADADDIADIFNGTKLRKLEGEKGKRMTPSRFSALSYLVDDTFKTTLTDVVRKYGRHDSEEEERMWMYAGGNALLAVLPGIGAFDCAVELEETFEKAMHNKAALSAGVIIFHKRFPIYVALEAVSQLLSNAKKHEGKASVDFELVTTIETTASDIDLEKRKKSKALHKSERPYGWERFKAVLEYAKRLPVAMESAQTAHIAAIAYSEGYEEARDYVKYQMGRSVVPWRVGEELVANPEMGKAGYLETGFFLDAFRIYNTLLKGKEEVRQ